MAKPIIVENDWLVLILLFYKQRLSRGYSFFVLVQVVLKESLTKHMRDVHQKTNKRQCHICCKVLSGPFSLKEHISAVHNKVSPE